jgi:uncharacterized protein YycO
MRGDILLYRTDGSLPCRIVTWATHGPYVHAEVDMGDGTSIGALSRGVARYYPRRDEVAKAARIQLPTDEDRINKGIAWLQTQVGHSYGYLDLYDQAVLFLKLPKLVFFIPGTYDCSDLVARYVTLAGGLYLGEFATKPWLCSPNDIARAAHLE